MPPEQRQGWGRREEDDRWKNLTEQLMQLVSTQHSAQLKLDALKLQVDEKFSEQSDELDHLKEFVLGGAISGRTSLETRIHDIENMCQEYKLALKGGDILNPDKGLISRVSRIENGETSRATRRGQIVALVGSLLFFVGTLATAIFTNADRIAQAFNRETPTEQATRIRKRIKAEKKDPKVQQRIKEDYGVNVEQ